MCVCALTHEGEDEGEREREGERHTERENTQRGGETERQISSYVLLD